MNKYLVKIFFNASEAVEIEVEAENVSEAVNSALLATVDDPTNFEVDDCEIECLEYLED
jgi:hypothetical protein